MIKPRFYKQCSHKWANYSWNGATVCRNGCGPSSIANAVSVLDKLHHPKANPRSCFKWLCRHGYMHPTDGTYYSGIKASLHAYGVKKVIHTGSMRTLLKHLKKGDFCICLCGKSRWTQRGHYVLAYGYKDGYVYISDSASSSPSRAKAPWSALKAAIKAHPYPQCWIIDNTKQYKTSKKKKTEKKKSEKKKSTAKKKKRIYPELPKKGYFDLNDHGVNVKRLQTLLKKAGYNVGKIDGVFGKKTENAVKRLQKKHGLTQDGKAGKQTINALKKALKAKK